jgi:acetyl esterase/lipase
MKQADYPPQEPLSAAGEAYGAECWKKGEGIEGREFAFGDDSYQRLIVHAPAQPDGRVLLFWHGGGWTSGYKEWMSFMAPAFNAAGVVFVTAGYRLAPQHVFPAALDDCAAAMRWVDAHIGEHGGDPGKVFIGGHSAGGHYAALLAVSERLSRARGLDPERVRGCLPLSGVYDFGEGSGLSMRPRFLGADAKNDVEASPIRQIERTPPFLIACGSNDFPHLVTQAAAFAAAMRAAGGYVERLVMPERTHFTSSFSGGQAQGPWVPRALELMTRFVAGS